MDYTSVIRKILYIIKKDNIPIYYDKFIKKMKNIKLKTNFLDDSEFVVYMTGILYLYHPHTCIQKIKTDKSNKVFRTSKNTEFDIRNNIGHIKLYSFSMFENADKYINSITKFLDKCTAIGVKGYVIDFRNHGGGDMHPLFEAFSRFFEGVTLFGMNTKKVTKKENKWVNIVNGMIVWNKPFITKNINTSVPIAIIVGPHTCSTGEFVASAFIASKHVRLFGSKTSGYLSLNTSKQLDKFMLNYTNNLVTTKNGKFLQYIDPDINTTKPIQEAIKFINTY